MLRTAKGRAAEKSGGAAGNWTPERRRAGPGRRRKGAACFGAPGTRPISSALASSGDGESDLRHPRVRRGGGGGGRSGNDIRGLCLREGVVCDRSGRRGRADLRGASGPGQDRGPFLGELPPSPALPGSPRPPLRAAPCMVAAPLSPRPLPPSLRSPCVPPRLAGGLLRTGTHSLQTRRPGGHWRAGAHAPARGEARGAGRRAQGSGSWRVGVVGRC